MCVQRAWLALGTHCWDIIQAQHLLPSCSLVLILKVVVSNYQKQASINAFLFPICLLNQFDAIMSIGLFIYNGRTAGLLFCCFINSIQGLHPKCLTYRSLLYG